MNWRELPAGRDLDRVIAERLGWKVVKVTWSPESSADSGWMYCLVSPDGVYAHGGSMNEDEAWIIPSHEHHVVSLKHYSTDANVAMTLWDNGYHWAVFPDPDQPGRFCATHPCAREYDVGIESGSTPAEAISRSWLAFGDKTNGCHN